MLGGGREEALPGPMVPTPLPSDCCDGTDEYNSGIICENTCKYVGDSPPSPPHPSRPCLAPLGESGSLSFLFLCTECSPRARCLVNAPSAISSLAWKQVQFA